MANEKKSLEDALDKVDQDTQFGLRRPNVDYRTPMYEKAPQVKNAWGNEPIPGDDHTHKMHKGAKVFFIISVAICVLAVLFAVFKSSGFFGAIKTEAIELTVDAAPFVDGGTATPISVHIVNKGTTALELVDLVLTYPEPKKESVVGADTVSYASSRVSLDDISIGATAEHTFLVTLFGSEGDIIPLTATLEYRVQNSSSIFTKEVKFTVQIRSTPLIVTVGAPDTIVTGQTIPYVITVTNKSPNVLEDLIVDAGYPPGFSYVKSDPMPLQGNRLWNIAKLDPGQSQIITVQAIITAQPLESKVVRASVGTRDLNSNQIAILMNTGVKTVTITQPFIATSLELNNSTSATVPVQENQRTGGAVTVTNSLSYPITNVVATLTFSGGLYSANGIEPKSGFFDSNKKAIIWQGGQLASIDAGESVSLDFDVTPKVQQGITDKTLKASLSLSAVVPGGIQPKLDDLQSITGVLATSLTFDAKTHYGGTAKGNAGPVPPKVGQKTKYNIVLDVSNNVNQVTNATLTTKIPVGVNWESSTTSGMEYNSVTRTVTWTMPIVPAKSGYGTNPVHGVFTVSITPSTSQANQPVNLTEPIEIVGTDAVTKVQVQHKRTQGLNTTLVSDPLYGSGQGTVAQ